MLTLKKITLLIGENNSGKTSFMAGLNHICGLLDEEDTTLNTEPFELGSFSDICHSSSKNKKKVTFDYECNIGEHSLCWTFENDQGVPSIKKHEVQKRNNDINDHLILDKFSGTLTLTLSDEYFHKLKDGGLDITRSKDGRYKVKMAINFDKRLYPSFMFRQSQMMRSRELIYYFRGHLSRALYDAEIKKGHIKESQLPEALLHIEFDEQVAELVEQIEGLIPDVYHQSAIAIAPLRLEPRRIYSFSKSTSKGFDPYGENLPAKLLSLTKSGNWNNFSKSLSEFGSKAGLFQKIKIAPLKKDSDYPFSIMVETGDGQTSNLMDVGYGVSQILPLIFELMTKRRSHRYLIQQPEVHLHPKAQAEFASLIATQCGSKKNQEMNNNFVIETHSDYMLDRFKYEIANDTISHEDIGILFFESSEGGKKIHQINLDEDGSPNNAPSSYRRFFLEEMERNWG